MAYCDIFRRYELKYILSEEQCRLIKAVMKPYMSGDRYGESDIRNLYCDTPDFLLARRSIEKPFYKEKLRIRSYGAAKQDQDVFVEIKKKYDSVVYKRRIATDGKTALKIFSEHTAVGGQIGREIAYFTELYSGIQPKMFISYCREAFYGIADGDFRVTFDRNILWRTNDLTLNGEIYGTPALPENKILMEIKTATSIPLWLVEALSENRIYKTSFSKYGTAYTLMLLNKNQGEQKVA